MKNFYHYLAESRREYKFRIKLIVPVNDDAMDLIERALRKYDLLEISAPRKTILQQNPLDFQDVEAAEIWLVDVITHLPVSSYVMMQELRSAMDIPEKYIVVRGENEPKELQTNEYNELLDIAGQAKDLDLVPASLLGDDEPAVDNSEMAFGDAYNKRLLDYLAQIQANRPDLTAEPKGDGASLFQWLQGPQGGEPVDFNEVVVDGVTPSNARDFKPGKEPVKPTGTTKHDTMKIDAPVARTYRDKDGKRTVLKAKK